ncbi:uncharacterized protein [Eurosta solidaginis]|uniref:uncharacterized protein n=1 Tax=Eurosta solidaginis TaxID=178769 RepID=UPI00353093D1
MMKMLQVNLFLTSICCLALFHNFAQCSTTGTKDNKEALITNITQQPTHSLEHWVIKDRGIRDGGYYKKLLNKGLSSRYDHPTIDQQNKPEPNTAYSTGTYETLPKNSHILNKKLLRKLGFIKVKAPNSHHRKRLAVESRRHTSPDDSHMFIIKLPPNFVYYTNPKSQGKSNNEIKSDPQKANVSTFPFNSNGKPGRIYHWNLPVMHKMLEKKKFSARSDLNGKKLNLKNMDKPWENDIEKSYKSNYKKSLKYKSPSYYAPTAAVHKNSFNRYFPGNGKPKGFYVIKENQRKNMYYKDIVP